MNNGENWTQETYESVEQAIGYRFSDRGLLLTAFTHSSYSNLSGEQSNERFEFLGDAVLELVVTEQLIRTRKEDEGKLTELRKQYVSKPALEQAEARLSLMQYLRHSSGDSGLGGKTSSNLFEAVVGAIYLDGGFSAAKKFLAANLAETETENYKTLLQEYVQERQKETPRYRTSGEGGTFTCTVSALGKSAEGAGESKKAAETAAAKALYKILTKRG